MLLKVIGAMCEKACKPFWWQLIILVSLLVNGCLVMCGDSEENDQDVGTNIDEIEKLFPHYAFDPNKAKRLALLEENLVSSLTYILGEFRISPEIGKESVEKLCHDYLAKYVRDYNEESEAVGFNSNGVLRAQQVVENPNLLFRMIRRLSVTLLSNTLEICEESEISGSVIANILDETFKTAKLELPTQRDLNDALMGILRIQYIYGFNATSELRLGIFKDVHTNAVLGYEDCLLLANKAIELKAEVLAYQWLRAASLSVPKIRIPEVSWQDATWEYNRLWGVLMKKTYTTSTMELDEMLQGKQQLEMESFLKFKAYATCRGESYYPGPPLYCYYNYWKPYYYIGPMKVEVLSEHPPVLQFYNEISNTSIKFFQRKASEKIMERTPVEKTHENQSNYGDYITSVSTLLDNWENKEDHDYWKRLERKLEMTTDISLGKFARPIQITLYGALGGFYEFHHDSLFNSVDDLGFLGDRLATVLMVMKDVKMGGYTAFPKLGVFAKPIKNSVIMWFNLKRNGKPDFRSLHGGCPVVLGLKQVARRGIDQYENMWQYPCDIRPEL